MDIRISSSDFEVTTDLERYVRGKLADVSRRVPRAARQTAHCQVYFAQVGHGDSKHSTCVMALQLGSTSFKAEETTQHMYAALDIATAHIIQQLRAHLATQKAGLRQRLKRPTDREWPTP